MKKVFLKAYYKNNLGDDLFLHIVSNRYKNKFYAVCSPKYGYHNRFNNINFNNSFLRYYAYRIFEKIKKKKGMLESKNLSKSDIILTIGGSIFIEEKNNSMEEMKRKYSIYKKNIPYCILGANFGPFYNDFYKEYIDNEIFNKAEDVCFRDSYSYDLFKQNPKVRQAADIVFSLDTSHVNLTNSDRVVFSIIECRDRFSNEIAKMYEDKMIELINYFIKLGYNITLMSFCKAEGDEDAINRILKRINSKIDNIDKYFYNGNVAEALNVLGKSKIIVGSRFHAMVLGMLLEKSIIPIIYSDKTLNLLDDVGYNSIVFDIRKAELISPLKIDSKALDYRVDISKQKKDAVNQFKILDELLK